MTDTTVTAQPAMSERPTATSEMRRQVATQIVEELFAAGCLGESDGEKAELAAELADAAQRKWRHDGYALAKELESRFGWDPSAEMVEHLDGFDFSLDRLVEKATTVWIADNNLQPPFENGTRVSALWGRDIITGTIDENYQYKPGYFAVKLDGGKDGSRALIRWEICQPLQDAQP